LYLVTGNSFSWIEKATELRLTTNMYWLDTSNTRVRMPNRPLLSSQAYVQEKSLVRLLQPRERARDAQQNFRVPYGHSWEAMIPTSSAIKILCTYRDRVDVTLTGMGKLETDTSWKYSKLRRHWRLCNCALQIVVMNCIKRSKKSDHQFKTYERLEVFTAETMKHAVFWDIKFQFLLPRKHIMSLKNGVFWVVTPCGSCKNRRFGGTWRLLHQGEILASCLTWYFFAAYVGC
jgi:hypothetical protein